MNRPLLALPVLVLAALLLKPTWAVGQDEIDDDRRAGRTCDPISEGAIRGIFPGIVAGFAWGEFSDEAEADLGPMGPPLLMGALGAVTGLLLDKAKCNPIDAKGADHAVGADDFEEDHIAPAKRMCDPILDGALFGIIPGTLAGYFWAFAGLEETVGGLTGGEAIALSGALGGLVGLLVDASRCNRTKHEDEEQRGSFFLPNPLEGPFPLPPSDPVPMGAAGANDLMAPFRDAPYHFPTSDR